MMEIDGYEIITEIAKTDNAYIYQCRRDGQTYAMKLLLLDKISRNTFARFKREMKILSHIKHANIVEGYNCGSANISLVVESSKTASKTIESRTCCYYVMEYIDGPSLGELLQNGYSFEESDVLHIALQILEALHFLQEKRILHRDIKPSNILLSREHKIKVADLGLAKALQSGDEPECEKITVDKIQLGTPFYMAPEAIMGEYGDLDFSVDIYSLGATMYHLLADFPPFWDFIKDKTQGNIFAHYLPIALEKKPTPLHDTKASVSPMTSSLVSGMLACEPSQRPDVTTLYTTIKEAIRIGKKVFPSVSIEPGIKAISGSLQNFATIKDAFFIWCLFDISVQAKTVAREDLVDFLDTYKKVISLFSAEDIIKLNTSMQKWNVAFDRNSLGMENDSRIFQLLGMYRQWMGNAPAPGNLPGFLPICRRIAISSTVNKGQLFKLIATIDKMLPSKFRKWNLQELAYFFRSYQELTRKESEKNVMTLIALAVKLFNNGPLWNLQEFAQFLQMYPGLLSAEGAAQLLIATSQFSPQKGHLNSNEFANFFSLYLQVVNDENEAAILHLLESTAKHELEIVPALHFYAKCSEFLPRERLEQFIQFLRNIVPNGEILRGVLLSSEILGEYTKDFFAIALQREDIRPILQPGDLHYLKKILGHPQEKLFYLRKLDKILAKGEWQESSLKEAVAESLQYRNMQGIAK